ncbi:glycosyltransferase family A protein [Flavobacterium adhaerens]|uniref:glycosyltransferase family A protein n=1 Tax=Flavobacterium adhaerens TaxID=3149043 RepID=UPI0032B4094A
MNRVNDRVVFNILTRTSNRPNGFKRCYDSIVNQTYKNIRHIVSFDSFDDLNYLSTYSGIETLAVRKNENVIENIDGLQFAPYNLYCNVLLDAVQEGWIIFLDDDINFLHDKVLEGLYNEILNANEDTMFVFQLRYPNGKLLPSNEIIKQKVIRMQNIDTSCYLFHSKYKDVARWDEWKAADYRFVKQLETTIPQIKWIHSVYIQNNNFEDLGRRNDLDKSALPKLIYYKGWWWYFLPKYHYQFLGCYIFQIEIYMKFIKKQFRRVKMKINKWVGL